MSKLSHEIWNWQKRFYSRPPIFATRYKDGEMTGNIYETRGGAELEVEYYARHGDKGMTILPMYAYTNELAKERWNED